MLNSSSLPLSCSFSDLLPRRSGRWTGKLGGSRKAEIDGLVQDMEGTVGVQIIFVVVGV
jgi:hypothetical protein